MKYSEAGKGGSMRPTDHKKWSSNYDNIKWTREEDEEFNRIQDSSSAKRAVAQDGGGGETPKESQATQESSQESSRIES